MDEVRSPRNLKKKKKDRGVYMRVSPLFDEVVKKQRKNINGVTQDSVNGSTYEVTDLLAKKLISNRLV